MTNSRQNSFTTIGSGRTDAGVHANAQIVRLELDFFIENNKLQKALNSLLPSSIKVTLVELCDTDFHPIFHAKNKEYKYYFSTKESEPFMAESIYYHGKDLDINLMNEACEILEGEHDFLNYFCTGTSVKTTIRTIFKAEITAGPPESSELDSYCLSIVGSGFLKQMVRLLMGALLNIGSQKITLEEFKKSLKVKSKNKLGAVAPPQGLYLYKVNY